MAATISTRNEESQAKKFLGEMSSQVATPVDFGMTKNISDKEPELHLGDWLEHFGIGPTEAAKIAGCGQSYISNMVRGVKCNINVLYLLKLSEHMGVTVNDFYRRIPSQAQINALSELSPKAQATLLAGKRKKA